MGDPQEADIDEYHGLYCSQCGEWIKDESHSLVDIADKEATCVEQGYKDALQCTVCGLIMPGEVTDKTDHKWDKGTVTTAATCESKGTIQYKCMNSGCTATRSEKIDALGHLFPLNENGGIWTDSGDGKTHYAICARAGCSYKESHLHWMGPWEVGRYATETQDGYMIRWCLAEGCTYHETMVLKAGSSPKTGDDSHLVLWSLTALAGLGGISLIGVYAIRKKKD